MTTRQQPARRTAIAALAAVLGTLAIVSFVTIAVHTDSTAEAAPSDPLGRVIDLTTTEVEPGVYASVLADVADCTPSTLMIRFVSDNLRAFVVGSPSIIGSSRTGQYAVSPDGLTGHRVTEFSSLPVPEPRGVDGPFFPEVATRLFPVSAPWSSFAAELREFDGVGFPPVTGATVDIAIWCIFPPGGDGFPPGGGRPS